MIDIKNLTAAELLNSEIVTRMMAEALLLASFGGREVKELAEKINQELGLDRKGPLSELEKQYQVLVTRLRYATLSFYNEKEIESFFATRIWEALGLEEFDVFNRLKAKLIEIVIIERDGFKERLRDALRRNNERTGDKMIIIDGQKKEAIISNWIKDYVGYMGEELDKVRQSQYLFYSPNTKTLSDQDREKLSQLINIYEKLGISSLTAEGLEESILVLDRQGNYKSLEGGQFINLFKAVPGDMTKVVSKPLPNLKGESEKPVRQPFFTEQLFQLAQGAPEFNAKIKKAEEELLKATNREINKIKAEINKAIEAKDDFKLIAASRILIRNNKLNFLWQENEELKVNFRPWLIKLGNEYGLDNEKLVSDFMARPDQPIYFKEFLRYSLEGKIGYQENMAAEVGLQMGSLLAEAGRKEFATMAYFDEASEEVKWTANKKTPQGLLTLPVY